MLDDAIRQLATAKNFGALAVHLSNGGILNHVMWVDATDEHILVNTETHRAKYLSLIHI